MKTLDISKIASLLLLLPASICWANVKYVKPTGSDSNDGSSWANAKATLRAAINAASAGDQVWVESGTYTNTGTTPFVTLLPGIAVYGGFVGNETMLSQRNTSQAAATTILNGSNAATVVNAAGALTTSNIFDGFTITNGKSSQFNGGGGFYFSSNGPSAGNFTIQNCIITSNHPGGTSDEGVGFYSAFTYPTLTNCTISNHIGPFFGAGVYISNSGTTHGAIINGCKFEGNVAGPGASGGALYLSNGTATCANSLFVNNTAFSGAAIYSTAAGPIESNTIVYNVCTHANSTSPKNFAGAGALYSYSSSAIIANNVLAYNTNGAMYIINAPSVLKYNDFYQNTPVDTNLFSPLDSTNIFANPEYNDPTNGDFSIKDGSPLIAAGSTTYVFGTTDYFGQPRIYNSSVDIGCGERDLPLSKATTPYIIPHGGISPVTVTIGDTSSYTTLHYTLDGSNPTAASPTISNGGTINIPSATTVVKVIAFDSRPNFTPSDIEQALFHGVPVTIYVDGNTGDDNNSGLSWSSPKKNPYSALNQAQSGDTVFVTSGNYMTSGSLVPKGVKVYGGFLNGQTLATRNSTINVTTFSGGGISPTITFEFQSDNSTALDGVTISNGIGSSGGGIVCNYSSPIISNCIITGNNGLNGNGGGIACNSAPPNGNPLILYNCSITNNQGSGSVSGCGVSAVNDSITVVNCVINGNSTGCAFGGGLFINANQNFSCFIINSTISYNTATSSGGGLYIGNSIVNITCDNNIISNNTSNVSGQEIYAPSASPTMVFNSDDVFATGAVSSTSGITLGAGSITLSPQFVSSTVLQPTAGSPCINTGLNSAYLASYPSTDIAGHTRIVGSSIDMGAYEYQNSSTTTFTGTVMLQGWTGSTLPQMALQIDNGSQTMVPLTPVSGQPSRGTFIAQLPSSGSHTVHVKPNGFLSQSANLSPVASSFTFDAGAANSNSGLIPGDMNNDNEIDDQDLLVCINNFLNPPPLGDYDANGDGVINDIDLLAVINNFLKSGS